MLLCYRDQQLLDDWRAETKDLQRKHYIRAVRNAQVQGKDNDPFGLIIKWSFQCYMKVRYCRSTAHLFSYMNQFHTL